MRISNECRSGKIQTLFQFDFTTKDRVVQLYFWAVKRPFYLAAQESCQGADGGAAKCRVILSEAKDPFGKLPDSSAFLQFFHHDVPQKDMEKHFAAPAGDRDTPTENRRRDIRLPAALRQTLHAQRRGFTAQAACSNLRFDLSVPLIPEKDTPKGVPFSGAGDRDRTGTSHLTGF